MSTLVAIASAQAVAMPAPVWRGVEEVAISCRVDPAAAQLTTDFCRVALRELRRDAPVIVRAADARPGGTATLNLEVAVTANGGALLVTIAGARAVEIDESQGALLPRRTRARPGEMAAATLARALDATLPWRRTHLAPPPLRQS